MNPRYSKYLNGGTEQKTCIQCGLPIEQYDNNPKYAEYEKKWSIHYDCFLGIDDMLDRQTGILSDRRSKPRKSEW